MTSSYEPEIIWIKATYNPYFITKEQGHLS